MYDVWAWICKNVSIIKYSFIGNYSEPQILNLIVPLYRGLNSYVCIKNPRCILNGKGYSSNGNPAGKSH